MNKTCHRRDGERGAVALMTIPVAAILVALALVFVTMIGGFTSDRRNAQTAADAAALAGAERWNRHLEFLFDQNADVEDFAEFWGLVGDGGTLPVLPPLGGSICDEATAFAQRNDADRLDCQVNVRERTVTVEVREREAVSGTGTHLRATATAELDLQAGFCISGSGFLGFRIDGQCVTHWSQIGDEPPEPPDDDDEDEDDEDDEEYQPPTLLSFRSDVRLVG